MEFNRKQLSLILEALRGNSRGMNVTEIAKETGMNRSTVAKYLEMLFVSGHVDMRSFGTSKVYYISQRMPISAFLNFTRDLIIILDKESRVLNANDSFFEFTNTKREDVVNKKIDHFAFPLKFNPSIDPFIREAIDGTETRTESFYRKNDRGYYFYVTFMPLIFEDGEKGVTVIFEDITEKKLAEKALRDSNIDLERKVRERTQELEKANETLRKNDAYLTEVGQIAHIGYWSFNIKTKEAYGSEESCRIFGIVPPATWSQETFRSRVHPDDRDMVEKADKEAMLHDKPFEYSYRILLPDGRVRYINSIREVLRGEAGNPIEYFGSIQDITAKRLMEEALKESEERYRALIEKSFDVVVSVKTGGEIIYVSPQIANYGYTPEEMKGRNFIDFVPAEHKDFVREKYRAAVAMGFSQPTEFKFIGKDGRTHWVEMAGKVVFDELRRPVSQIGTIRNIDERRRAEDALRNSELRFKTLFEGACTAIFIIDLSSRGIVDCNSYGARLVGWKKEELIGTHHSKLHPPEFAETCRNNARIHPKDNSPMNYETELIHKDGHRIPVVVNANVLEIDGKRTLIGTYMDITERKRAEEKLAWNEKFQRNIFESIQDGINVLDRNMTIIRVNATMEKWYGKDIVGKKCYEAFHKSSGPCEGCPSIKAMKEKCTHKGNIKDPRGWNEIYAFPMVDDNGEVVGVIEHIRDITERINAENALRESEARLLKVEWLMEKCQEAGKVGCWQLDVIKNDLWWSSETYRMFNIPQGTPMNYEKFMALVHEEDREYVDTKWRAAYAGESFEIDYRAVVDGNVKWIQTRAKGDYDANGRLVSEIGTDLDITERKLAEQALRESEEKFRNIIEGIQVIVWQVDENNVCTYVNPKSADILGYEPGELLGRDLNMLIAPEDRELVKSLITAPLKERLPFEIRKYRAIRKDGSIVYFKTNAIPIFDDNGQFKGYRGVNRDITDAVK